MATKIRKKGEKMTKYMQPNVPGFTTQDSLDFRDLLIKANEEQLIAMINSLERQLAEVLRRKPKPKDTMVCLTCNHKINEQETLSNDPNSCIYCKLHGYEENTT